MKPWEHISEQGKYLQIHESLRIHCPFCGDKSEKSMSITRRGTGYLYICYRATCDKRGIVGAIPHNAELAELRKKKKKEPKYCASTMEAIPLLIFQKMLEPYQITLEDCARQRFKWAREHERLYMPTFNRMGYEIGGSAKVCAKGKQPKVIQYYHSDVPMLHYPLDQELSSSIVLVEDTISSVKVSKVAFCAALLGSSITAMILGQLLKDGTTNIILMLDEDACNKAIKIKRKVGSLFNNFDIVRLPKGKDPKDLSTENLKELLWNL